MREKDPIFDKQLDLIEINEFVVGREGGLVGHYEVVVRDEYELYKKMKDDPVYGYKVERPITYGRRLNFILPDVSLSDISESWEDERVRRQKREADKILHEGELIEIKTDKIIPDEY